MGFRKPQNKAKQLSGAGKTPFLLALHCIGTHGSGCKAQPSARLSIRSEDCGCIETLGQATKASNWLLVAEEAVRGGGDAWGALCPLCGLQLIAQMLERAKATESPQSAIDALREVQARMLAFQEQHQ